MLSRSWMVGVVMAGLCGCAAAVGADPEPVRLADDFAADSRAAYQITEDVAWQKGQVTLGRGARLTRRMALGHTAELRAVVRFPASVGPHELQLQFEAGKAAAQVTLTRVDGRTVLVNQGESEERVA